MVDNGMQEGKELESVLGVVFKIAGDHLQSVRNTHKTHDISTQTYVS